MGLNVSKGNMYSWVTHTWNPIKGECSHGCTYCYMKRWGNQKPIKFDEKELNTDLGSGNFIFVGSSCDLFANDIPYGWIKRTLDYCNSFDNTYLLQSKNVVRIWDFHPLLPPKTKICTTIETNRWLPDVMNKSPKPEERSGYLARFKGLLDCYITVEPIIDFDLDQMLFFLSFPEPKQINIGADSGDNHLPEPSKEKLLELIAALKEFTMIDQKRNLNRILKGDGK
jgi:DNA repair photolyase